MTIIIINIMVISSAVTLNCCFNSFLSRKLFRPFVFTTFYKPFSIFQSGILGHVSSKWKATEYTKVTPSSDLGDERTCNPSYDRRLSLRRRSTPQLGCCGRQIKIKMVDFYHTFDFWALIRIDTVTCMFWYESWICMSWWKRPCIYLLNRGRDGKKTFQEWQYGEVGERGSKVQLQCIGRSPCNHKIITIINIVDAFIRQYLFLV